MIEARGLGMAQRLGIAAALLGGPAVLLLDEPVNGGLPLILVPLGTSVQNAAGQFMPMMIAENSLTAVKPVAHSLSPGVGFALLCAYAAAALAAGGWALARRDV